MLQLKCQLLILIFFTGIFINCQNQHEPNIRLDQAEQLINSDPQKSIQLLNSIDPKNLKKKDKHNLYFLKIHAAYASGQDISNYPNPISTASYFERKDNIKKAGWSYLYSGIIFKANGNYEKASIDLSEAKENANMLQDSMLLFQIYYHFGDLYELSHDQQASIESYQKAINYHILKDQNNDPKFGDCLLYTKQYVKAREYYQKAELHALRLQDSANTAHLMLQIGISYSKTKNKNSAIYHIQKSLEYNNKAELEKYANLLLSEIYLDNHQVDSASYYLEKDSLRKSDRKELQALHYKLLSRIAEAQNDYKTAFFHYKKYTQYSTDYQQEKTENRIDNMVNHYNNRKWQTKNYKLIHQRSILARSIIILILLLLLIITYIYIILKKRRSKYSEACQMIETLEVLCQQQNQTQDKFKELLLNKLEVSKKLARISSYPHEKHQTFLKMYNEILGDFQHIVLNWEELYFTINYLYNNFEQRLKERFPQLNEKEIQLCCLLRGGFRTDEIIIIIQQSVYSIHKRKTIIRKKTGMDERADIISYLLSKL